jgi:acyl-CoA synthetase (AMP-forming)/AMP-acid ligase II
MPTDLARQLMGRVEALWNLYGPTETTIWSTSHRVRPSDLELAREPIGRPIANTRVYVLEPQGSMAPVGAPGELVIAGEGVARGYCNRPDLTQERFIEISPFERSESVYRTGDRARWRADGTLEFLGRDDGQVKVRGFRIELGEVEAALASHPSVRQAYAGVSEGSGGAVLVAYLVFQPGEEPTTSELRRYVRARLPDYMVPSLFVGLEAPPLSPNGKVDRRRLPDPFLAARTARKLQEPRSPGVEQVLGDIWATFLGVGAVGPHDNFFELGGHSLLSLRVAAAFERQMGLRLDPRALFFQTLREVAAGATPRQVGVK